MLKFILPTYLWQRNAWQYWSMGSALANMLTWVLMFSILMVLILSACSGGFGNEDESIEVVDYEWIHLGGRLYYQDFPELNARCFRERSVGSISCISLSPIE